jgi:hypothetical protein
MRGFDPRPPDARVFRGLRVVGVLQSSHRLFATQVISKSVINRTVIYPETGLSINSNGLLTASPTEYFIASTNGPLVTPIVLSCSMERCLLPIRLEAPSLKQICQGYL